MNFILFSYDYSSNNLYLIITEYRDLYFELKNIEKILNLNSIQTPYYIP